VNDHVRTPIRFTRRNCLMARPLCFSSYVDMTLSDITVNQGGGSAAASTTRFFPSTDSIFDSSDISSAAAGR
jgi:hypothetical protein